MHIGSPFSFFRHMSSSARSWVGVRVYVVLTLRSRLRLAVRRLNSLWWAKHRGPGKVAGRGFATPSLRQSLQTGLLLVAIRNPVDQAEGHKESTRNGTNVGTVNHTVTNSNTQRSRSGRDRTHPRLDSLVREQQVQKLSHRDPPRSCP